MAVNGTMPPSLLVRRIFSSAAARRRLGILLEHHAILIRLSVNSGDQPLAEGVVQRVIDIGH